jgi:hypothetical protein
LRGRGARRFPAAGPDCLANFTVDLTVDEPRVDLAVNDSGVEFVVVDRVGVSHAPDAPDAINRPADSEPHTAARPEPLARTGTYGHAVM